MRRELALALLAPLVLASFLGGFYFGEMVTEQRIKVGPYEARGILVQVEVYRNGELMFIDYDDPATDNFLTLLSYFFLVVDPAVDTRGGATTSGFSAHVGSAMIGISDDTATSFSTTLNELPGANVLVALVDDTQVTVDASTMSITISGTITIPSGFTNGFTVGWVGLYVDPDEGTIDGDEILIFADPLGTNSFVANPGDVITVVYKITAP